MKAEFGSREKLIAAIVETEARKDEGYGARFESWPTPRLWDYYRSAKARAAS